MKYMLLMGTGQDVAPITTWAQEEVRTHIGFMQDFNAKLIASGELVDAQGLAFPEQAKIVRARPDGLPAVTDGPFPESKEFLIGYWIVDCADEARAVEIAAEVSAAPGPGGTPIGLAIEVRQIMSAPSSDL